MLQYSNMAAAELSAVHIHDHSIFAIDLGVWPRIALRVFCHHHVPSRRAACRHLTAASAAHCQFCCRNSNFQLRLLLFGDAAEYLAHHDDQL